MLLLYTHEITPRLRYIVDFFSQQLFEEPIVITSNREEFVEAHGYKLNYSNHPLPAFTVRPVTLLYENNISLQEIHCFDTGSYKAFYKTDGDFGFDIFAASFYLLSRYEEYLPHEKDKYGRFPHTASLAWKEQFLHLPLINIWLEDFKRVLKEWFPNITFTHKRFKCILSYDIDIAYSYRHKGWVRTAGGFARSLLKGKWNELNERWEVLRGRKTDPFDCYEWLDALHLYCRMRPYFFFLVAEKSRGFDKNISPNVPAFQQLVKYYSQAYKTGLHPSWQSGDDAALLREEREWLSELIDRPVIHSRQHYIRLSLPDTYRKLIAAGIEKEFSMGYGSLNGFRASVCSSFHWYDLAADAATSLVVYPFCFMDTTSAFEQKDSASQAWQQLRQYYEQVKKLNGLMISIWHNFQIGTSPNTIEWREMFELFMREVVYWDAYAD